MVVGIAGSFSVDSGSSQLAACPGETHAVAVGEGIADLVIGEELAVVIRQEISLPQKLRNCSSDFVPRKSS